MRRNIMAYENSCATLVAERRDAGSAAISLAVPGGITSSMIVSSPPNYILDNLSHTAICLPYHSRAA